ncbi:Aste57867_910 [Aphanomyces stellatus]|uniref:Aste57867_910 protein n=1 Tax=Aphanomyces stellatus TaxID=120398 RepID=A0A485K529_9STRA|nr:hypothetical protein As57867_000909 [Aphanomyces stellatus]VFT78134.1 Aste57867_910 [Aphanomyces stellatus]
MKRVALPASFFRCPPLSPHETDAYERQALACATDVIDLALSVKDPQDWFPFWHQSDLRILRGPNVGAACTFVAETTVCGTIDEVAVLFETDTTDHAKAYVARVGRDLDDAVSLYSWMTASSDKMRLTWMAVKPPVQKLLSTRDCSLLECHRIFNHHDGRRGWVRAMRSVDVPGCPDLKPSLGLVRMDVLAAGHVAVQADRGCVRLLYVVQVDTKINAGDWAVELMMQRRGRSLLDIDRFLREDRLSRMPFVPLDCLQPKHTATTCHLCAHPFGFTWRKLTKQAKTHCVKCGFVHCTNCVRLWHVKDTQDGPRTSIWACSTCAMGGAERLPTAAKPLTTIESELPQTIALGLHRFDDSAGSPREPSSLFSILDEDVENQSQFTASFSTALRATPSSVEAPWQQMAQDDEGRVPMAERSGDEARDWSYELGNGAKRVDATTLA